MRRQCVDFSQISGLEFAVVMAKRIGTDRCALRWGSAGGQIVGGKMGSDHRTRCTTGAQRP
jgi:hypothetical protein